MTRSFVGFVWVLSGAIAAAACGGGTIPNDAPDMPVREDDPPSSKLPPTAGDDEGSDRDGKDDPTRATTEDAGPGTDPPATKDGGSKDGGNAGAVNAFTGAPPFVKQTGPSTSNFVHGIGGNPAKKACLDCHGKNGIAPQWFAAGTVYTDASAKTPAASVEVRLRDANGNAVLVHTDALGSFFVPIATATAAKMTPPILAGVRDATTTKLMGIVDPSGNCNQSACHGGTQGFVHVP